MEGKILDGVFIGSDNDKLTEGNRDEILENFQGYRIQNEKDKDFAINMLHDIRTPLSSLIGYLDILYNKKVENVDKLEKYLEKSLEKTNQIKDLTDTLFAYLLDPNEKFVTSRNHKITTRESFRSIILDGIFFLEDKGVKVNLKANETSESYINISERNIQRIFDNVFSNALKYGYQDGYVLIYIEEKEDLLKFKMKNKIREGGIGIESHGIGLKWCQEILLRNKGFLMIKSAGGCFQVDLGFRKL